MSQVEIICEAGVNHNGSIEVCKELIRIANISGANIIKFQAYRADELSSKAAPNAEYAKRIAGSDGESHNSMLQRLELSQNMMSAIEDFVRNNTKLSLLYSVFDRESLKYLLAKNTKVLKLPSGEIDNIPLIREIGISFQGKIIISTGMSNEFEIERCLNEILRYGNHINNIILLHCTTSYPTELEEVNMSSMVNMGKKFGVTYGYSDHTIGSNAAVIAVALGARYIEKHITLSRLMSGPDHQASIQPFELIEYVKTIRQVEKAIGNGIKNISSSEIPNLHIARKSIFTTKKIRAGEFFSAENLTTKRPGDGVSASEWDNVIGTKAIKNFDEDEKIILK